jgi:hypothetical protein
MLLPYRSHHFTHSLATVSTIELGNIRVIALDCNECWNYLHLPRYMHVSVVWIGPVSYAKDADL